MSNKKVNNEKSIRSEDLFNLLNSPHSDLSESLDDFEKEALEGYVFLNNSEKSKDLHTAINDSIDRVVDEKNKKPKPFMWWGIAAGFILLVGLMTVYINTQIRNSSQTTNLADGSLIQKTPIEKMAPPSQQPVLSDTKEEVEATLKTNNYTLSHRNEASDLKKENTFENNQSRNNSFTEQSEDETHEIDLLAKTEPEVITGSTTTSEGMPITISTSEEKEADKFMKIPEVSSVKKEMADVSMTQADDFKDKKEHNENLAVSNNATSVAPTNTNYGSAVVSKATISQIDSEPLYKQGKQALTNYIKEKINTDDKFVTKKGAVIQFTVTKKGFVTEIVLKKEFQNCSYCNDQLVKIIQQTSKDWLPAKKNNKSVSATYSLEIDF